MESYYVQEDGQMAFDTRLESDRNIEENISAAVEFTCKQIASTEPPRVTSRHDGYGIASQFYSNLKGQMKEVDQAMKYFLAILPLDDSKGIEAASSLKNAGAKLTLAAVLLTAQADRIMNDLYKKQGEIKTPLEEYADSLKEDDFEGSEEEPEEDTDTESKPTDISKIEPMNTKED